MKSSTAAPPPPPPHAHRPSSPPPADNNADLKVYTRASQGLGLLEQRLGELKKLQSQKTELWRAHAEHALHSTQHLTHGFDERIISASAVSNGKQDSTPLMARCAELEEEKDEAQRKGRDNLTELRAWTSESINVLKKRCDEVEILAGFYSASIEEATLSLNETQQAHAQVDQSPGAVVAQSDVESGRVQQLEKELSDLRQLCDDKDGDLAGAKDEAKEVQLRHEQDLAKMQLEMEALQEKMVLAYSWHDSGVGVDKEEDDVYYC